MATLKQVNAANFEIANPDPDGANFTYYSLVGCSWSGYNSIWDIVGVSRQLDSPSLVLRLLHIEDEVLEAEDTDTLQHASSFMSFDPEGLLTLITFFEEMKTGAPLASAVPSPFFRLISSEELQRFHFKPVWQRWYTGFYYQYRPSQEELQRTMVTLLLFPHWSAEHETNQHAALHLVVFREEQLADPTFDPLKPHGVDSINLDQPALMAFIDLLKEHTYEK
jgi:hypothetical protein